MKPFFSIIIPCCDVEPYVRECLDSVLAQDFQSWECLVGVETSKDRTEAVVREYAARDPRFRVFTGPRSGSCSASRNTGTDMSEGEYVIFLDGDDTIAEGSLRRIADAIEARPGADLYPCAIVVRNELTGRDEETRDNYPADFRGELTGVDATIMVERAWKGFVPCPMLQLTVFRREFLVEHDLKCIYGLRMQDSEFSPRALYLAKRVVPLHEPFYIYRIRRGSVQTVARGAGYFHKDLAIRLHSLMAFHAKVSAESGFDSRVGKVWAQRWTATLFIRWFFGGYVREMTREERLETLKIVFADGFGDFNRLLRYASPVRRFAALWVKWFVRRPSMRGAAEKFFKWIYFPLLRRF
jgi:glycosyltransferase involved in cell wall biosynthesis